MDISEIIRMITGGTDPNAAVLNAQGAMPPSGPPPQQVSPPAGTTPQGVPTPVTNPAPADQAPKTLQSPPDLANMYATLMARNQNAAQLDSGLHLIAAGLSNSPTNRAALIGASGQGGGKGMSLSASDLINFEKQKTEATNAIIRKNALPALMKQYKMTPAQAQYLEAGGKLDEVIKHYSTENLGTAEDAESGQKILFNQRTGQEITRLGGEKPEEGTWQDGPQGKVLVSSRTGLPMNQPLGLPPDKIEVTRPDGSKVIVDKAATASGTQVAPARKVGDEIPALTEELYRINQAREAEGKPLMTHEELIKLKQHPGVTVNTGKGADLPFQPPEKGYEYYRNPDGSIKLDAEGKPSQYKIAGGGPASEEAEKLAKMTKEDAEKAKKEAVKKSQEAFASSNVGNAIEKAFDNADKFGASGFGSKVARGVPIGGMSWDTLDSALNTINANTAFAQLAKMREAAATGASGLGQVTEKENQMLSSVISDLRAYQDTYSLKRGLARTKAAMELLAHNDYKTQAEFDVALSKRAEEVLAERHNKTSKIKVTPR